MTMPSVLFALASLLQQSSSSSSPAQPVSSASTGLEWMPIASVVVPAVLLVVLVWWGQRSRV